MTVPPQVDAGRTEASNSSLIRVAIWVAIGALIAAAIVCVVWVFVGAQNGIVGRAFLTILLLAAFAGAAILDAHLAPRRPAWFALASMAGWVLLLLVGAVLIWLPERDWWSGVGFVRFVQFLVIVLIVQLALLHARLYIKSSRRFVTPFTQTVTYVTVGLVVGLVVLLILPLTFGEWVYFADLYWRIVVAITILAAVGTALVPLVNVLFAPKKERPAAPAQPSAAGLLPWPTYVDGVTPLPVMPDRSPDWGAYYTGYPSPGAQVVGVPAQGAHAVAAGAPSAGAQSAPVASAPNGAHAEAPSFPPSSAAPETPAAPGYEGYPPPPPLPPQ
jgi:MFS family permease